MGYDVRDDMALEKAERDSAMIQCNGDSRLVHLSKFNILNVLAVP